MGPTSDFKSLDAGSYDNVVSSFERFTERYTTPLAKRLVALGKVTSGDAVLDVGTGTAVVALRAARAADTAAGGRVLGVDLSEGMLETARAKAAHQGIDVAFRAMDAEQLDIEDGQFDVILSLFALTHFPDPGRALREMLRVLRPGGRLAVGVGSGPTLLSLPGWWRRALIMRDLVLEKFGRRLIAPQSLERWLHDRVRETAEEVTDWAAHHHNRSRPVPTMVRDAGFDSVGTSWMGRIAELDSPEDFWELQATNSSKLRKRLATQPKAEVESLRAEYLEECRAVLARGGKLVYPYAAFFVSARKGSG